MSIFARVWLNPILGVFRPWEKAVLEAVANQMVGRDSEVLKRQVDRITYVQREDGGRTANLYSTDQFGQLRHFADNEKLANTRASDYVLAKVVAEVAGNRAPIVVHVANGRIFSLSILAVRNRGLRRGPVRILSVQFLRQTDRDRCEASLPIDFDSVPADMVRRAGVTLFQREDLYSTVLDGVEYCVFGLVGDEGVLASPLETEQKAVYVCRYGDSPTPLAADLATAVRKMSDDG